MEHESSSDDEEPPPKPGYQTATKTRDNPDPTLILKGSAAKRRPKTTEKQSSAGISSFDLVLILLTFATDKENEDKETAMLKKQVRALQKKLLDDNRYGSE